MRQQRQKRARARAQARPEPHPFPGIDLDAAEAEHDHDSDPEANYRAMDRWGYDYLRWWEKMTMTKQQIAAAAESGILTDADSRYVVRSDYAAGTVRYLHVWSESTDARVWDGVKRVAMRAAREVARATGRSVDVYSADGFLLEQVEVES